MAFRNAFRPAFRALPVVSAGACAVRLANGPGADRSYVFNESTVPSSDSEKLQAAFEQLQAENARLEKEVKRLSDQERKDEVPIYRVVVTGGPCGGKTSALVTLRVRLENMGWRVFTVPEAATLLFHNGARFQDFEEKGNQGVVHFQTQLARMQIRLESTMYDMAVSSGQRSVLLCDRGVMDGKAYCSPSQWALVLDALGQTESQLRDRRYDAVLHLVTAAKGAEQFYTLQQAEGTKSSARTETVHEAQTQDDKTSTVWVGHEHLYIIENKTTFQKKLDRALDRVLKCIGESVPGHTLRKIKLPYTNPSEIARKALESGVESVRIFQCSTTYVSANARVRVRSDLDHTGASYYFQSFTEARDGHLIREKEKMIDSHSYMQILHEALASGNKQVEKQLVCFKWNDVLYEVNVFQAPERVCILEVEAENKHIPVMVPPFLEGAADQAVEVTNVHKYDTRQISRRFGKEA